jgi:hypothetical protein
VRSVASTIASACRAAHEFQAQRRAVGNRNGRSYAIGFLTPVRPWQGPHLARTLRGFGTGAESPLAMLPYVHFARWVVVDQLKTDWAGAPRRPPRLKSEYLLFTADVTAPGHDGYELPAAFLRELLVRIPAQADEVWGHCQGYPGTRRPEEFVRYFASSQLDVALYYAAYPDATVDEIREALRVRRELIRFARTHQQTDPAKLQDAYRAASGTWFP